MVLCSVPKCNKDGVHFFPKELNLRQEWEKAIRRKDFVATKYSRLCRFHFKKSDYVGKSAITGKPQERHHLRKGSIPSIFMCNKNTSTPASKALRHKEIVKCQMEYTVDEKTASKMETLPCSEETLTEQCRKMIYNVFVYLKLNRKDEQGDPLTRTGLVELTSEVTGISRRKVEQIVYDIEGNEGIVKEELDIGPVVLYKPSSSSFIAQEMSDRAAEPVVVKQEPELQQDVPSLGSPETLQVDASSMGLLLPVKREPDTDDFIKQEIDIGPTVLYKPQL